MAKYTEELANQIIELIKQGNFASVAYEACGISKDTFYEWVKNKPDFADSIKKAKSERISTLVSAIKTDSSWQSKAWMLERLSREKYHLLTASEKDLQEQLDDIKRRLLAKEKENTKRIKVPEKAFFDEK